MIKKIPIEELEPGMYVCGLERPGDLEVSSFMNNIRVDSVEDVKRFKDSGYSVAHVDLPDEPHGAAPRDQPPGARVGETPGPVDEIDALMTNAPSGGGGGATPAGPVDGEADEWAKLEDGPIFFDTAGDEDPGPAEPTGPVEGETTGLATDALITNAAPGGVDEGGEVGEVGGEATEAELADVVPIETSSFFDEVFEDPASAGSPQHTPAEAPVAGGAGGDEMGGAITDDFVVWPEPAGQGEEIAGPKEHCDGTRECGCDTEGPDKKKANKGCACEDEEDPWTDGGGVDRAGGAGSR